MKCGAMSWLSIFFQVCLIFLAGLVLIIKWSRERPRRKLYILFLDTSKQLCSGSILHCINLVMAVFTIKERESSIQEIEAIKNQIFFDQCDWYFLSFICDFLYTVPLTFTLFRVLDKRIAKLSWLAHLESGCYYFGNGDINWKAWTGQLLLWITVSGSVKVTLLFLQIYFKETLLRISHFLLETTTKDPPVKSFIVFFFCPLIVNSIQIIIFDYLLKKKSKFNKKFDVKILKKHYTHYGIKHINKSTLI
jgi:hypothetical protein